MAEAPPVVAVVGPTAVGKSDLGIAIARALSGEVINSDSMQLYRGMDIGTAKLPEEERGGIAHHLLDVWEVTQPASAAIYQRLARERIDDLRGRGIVPVLVGGSGLYVQAALDDLDFPGTDPRVRARVEQRLAAIGAPALHDALRAIDPVAAANILPTNGRRIVRALEVIELTGAPFRATLPTPKEVYPTIRIGIDAPDEVLDARIEARVDRMWDAGLVDEVCRLAALGLRDGPTASRALGYAQVLRLLDGEITEEGALADTKRATRRFARRQRSWLRRDGRVHWLTAGPDVCHSALTLIDKLSNTVK